MSGLNAMPSSNKIYASVISDGSIRVKVDEGTPNAVKREYETRDGIKSEKWENVYSSIDGIICDINFNTGDFGDFINIDFLCDKKIVCLSLNADSGFGQDIMKKIPNINLEKMVRVAPYSMINKAGKNLKGITVYQDGQKLPSFFYDVENNKNINGFPESDKSKEYTKDDWKIYFITVKQFLKKYIEENIIPNIVKVDGNIKEEDVIQIEEEINIPSNTDIIVDEIDFNIPSDKKEEKVDHDEIIKELIFNKYGISKMEDVKVKAMEVTSLAYLPSNKEKIIEALKLSK